MNRTTVSLTPENSASLRHLAAELEYYLPRPLGSRVGNISALLNELASAYQLEPQETLKIMAELLRHKESLIDQIDSVNNQPGQAG